MKTKLPGGHAILGQGMILLFFIPFNILIWIVVGTNISAPKLVFAFCTALLSTIIILLVLKTADVSIEADTFLIKNIFRTVRKPSSEYKQMGTFFPLGYHLEFKDGKKIYILFGPDQIIRQFTSSEPKFKNEISDLINQGVNS